MDASSAHAVIESAKSWVYAISAVFLAGYPIWVLLWTIVEGSVSSDVAKTLTPAKEQDMKAKGQRASCSWGGLSTRVRGLKLAADGKLVCLAAVSLVATVAAVSSPSFVAGAVNGPGACGKAATRLDAPPQGCGEDPLVDSSEQRSVAMGVLGGAGLLGMVVAIRSVAAGRRAPTANGKSHRRRKVMRRCSSSSEAIYTRCERSDCDTRGVPSYKPPSDTAFSMWHYIDLHVKTWLDEETGLFRYVNEIPMGSLQKFELQTSLEENVIREDVKGTRKLKAFGCPVPFNYGCFPQTFRDPDEVDDIFGAPGDNDPLDVLDLCTEPMGVGEVVCCRPLGAVCLIDEGQADWKVIAVNTKHEGPLAGARSVEEAERIAPGRIKEVLQWMDDFKKSSGKSDTTLHYKIYDAEMAVSIIEKDHSAWRRLVAEAAVDGTARGHWIRSQHQKEAKPEVMKFGWPSQMALPSQLAGTSVPTTLVPSYASGRALTMRRQTSANSDGGDSASSLEIGP